ncbi:methionyl-tRNA formyltransferase [Soehngenia longivitae]|uniref:Methionyl-tRNA formyltransferase n=2 Tax=Soehngenia longivitae TaxID=2562294 RepID=A0A4Z0D2P6_9FIRM|nr:methionyl-tRNA formyltransferase [Soehngenia longivitae]
MGTSEFAVKPLKKLKEAGHDILLVITQPDKRKGRGKVFHSSPVKKVASELGLVVYQPTNINSDESVKTIAELKPDFLVVIAYGQILKNELLGIAKYENINIHASLLPKYRGAAPINWAIANGETVTGVTSMKITKGLDSGPILLQRELPILESDDSISLSDKLSEMGAEILIETINLILTGKAVYIEQDNSLSSYAPILTKEIGKIDWGWDIIRIKNHVRAFKPWPGSYFYYDDQIVKVNSIDAIETNHDLIVGTIYKIDNDGIWVAAKNGFIIIKELQFPGKKMMLTSEYLKGNRIEIGKIV